MHCLAHSSGIALFPRVLFPPSDYSDHRVGWFDAPTSWGMGGAFLVPRGAGYVAYFYVFEWSVLQQLWHVNVLEAVAGLTLLVTGHVVLLAPFVTEFGDSNVANASARKNASPNLQIAQVLRHRASLVKDEQITTRQFRVSSEENVLGGPLSRGPKYMALFKKNARDQDATSFVRMKIPSMIFSLAN